MGLKYYKPVTPGLRHKVSLTYEEITKDKPEKSLTIRLKKQAGRNNQGKMTIRHHGGGARMMYRMIDFRVHDKLNIPGKVTTIEYDPNRSAFIMLVTYADGEKRYHLAPNGVKVGTEIVCKVKAKVKPGNRMMLKHMPQGYDIHNIEMEPGRGGKLVRAAGAAAKLVSLEGVRAQIQMPSGEIRLIPKECYATIGVVSNLDHENIEYGKAGLTRHHGRRPHVRGKAMNPVDHPHGGGEGNQPIGHKSPLTPWGKVALGLKTRNRKKYSSKWILKRRK